MIRKVVIRRFKRFDEVTFDLDGKHIVLAGPNNAGKTTVLQAIAAWAFGLNQWRRGNDLAKHYTAYSRRPITRQMFTTVALKSFDALWVGRDYSRNGPAIEVEVQSTDGWTLTMEFEPDSTEQIYVRPLASTDPTTARTAQLVPVFIPPMTGVSTDEPVYRAEKVEQLIGLNRPGDVLRNLLLTARDDQDAWKSLRKSIDDLFHIELLPPNDSGPDILCQYRQRANGHEFDIASAGAGFQQVLMLLAYLETRPGTVLLIDEPDAHLHVFLQEAIFHHLRRAAVRTKSQLIVSTHSEVIIDSVGVDEIYVLLDVPLRLSSGAQRETLVTALRCLDNVDLMKARQCPGVLYLEDYTDLAILREWARILEHPASKLLEPELFWKKLVSDTRPGGDGMKANDHYACLQLVKPELPALELVDGDSRQSIQSSPITGCGFQRLRWRRYEIESYLVHPESLARFVTDRIGEQAAGPHVDDLKRYLDDNLPPAVGRDPLGDHDYLNTTKARVSILPPALTAAGLPGFDYTEYYRIAAMMRPDEMHPEIREKLDGICRAFGVTP